MRDEKRDDENGKFPNQGDSESIIVFCLLVSIYRKIFGCFVLYKVDAVFFSANYAN